MMNIESSHEKNIENDDRKHKTIEQQPKKETKKQEISDGLLFWVKKDSDAMLDRSILSNHVMATRISNNMQQLNGSDFDSL